MYRRLHNAANPYIKPLYHALDRRIMVCGREIPVRVFCPKSDQGRKVLIFFHGGGWVTGNIDTYTHICVNMARQTKHTVVSVDYRLAPEHPFPAGLEDCYFAAREIFLQLSSLACRSCDITLIGDSAGGNLAAAVSLMAKDRGEFMPDRQILLYPSTYSDHSEKSPFDSIRENGTDYILTSKRVQSYMELYVSKETDRCSPYVAPLLAQDLSCQPKTLIITAQFDLLRDEGEAYGERLREFQNDVTVCRIEDALHGFLVLPKRSETVQKCYRIIRNFLSDENEQGEVQL